MARPAKNNAEYFPHLTSLRNHRKVKVLRNKFGQVLGYAFWCMMLEWLTEHDGLEWENSDIEVEMFASELGVSAAEIRSMLQAAVNLQLISLTNSGFYYSESLNENLQPVFEKRNRERERSKERKKAESEPKGVSAAEIQQSKEKERKGEESKEKEILDDAIVVESDFIHDVDDVVDPRPEPETHPEKPKKAARSKKKNPEEYSIVTKIKESVLQISPGYRWNGIDGKHAKELAAAISGICCATISREPTDDETLKYIRKMIDHIPEYWDSWTIPKLNGAFNEISAKIQKPRSRGKIMDSAIAIHQATQSLLDKGLVLTYNDYINNINNPDDEPF